MEEWAPIPEFPGYFVSTEGYVQHERRSRDLTRFKTNTGTLYVGLTIDHRTYNRSLALLVANAFLPPPQHESFDTPIHLDGNRSNNTVDNLKWRPLWFARKYYKQFPWDGSGNSPVILPATAEVFPNTWIPSTKYGLLNIDLIIAIANGEKVWPTGQLYYLFK